MPAWLVWVIVAAVLGGVEMLSLTLVAGLLGVAAVAAAATAALGVGGAGQAAAFAVTSGVSIAILLPALRRAPLPREKRPGRRRYRRWLSPRGRPQTARRARAPFGASKRRARSTTSETTPGAPGDRQVARSGRESKTRCLPRR